MTKGERVTPGNGPRPVSGLILAFFNLSKKSGEIQPNPFMIPLLTLPSQNPRLITTPTARPGKRASGIGRQCYHLTGLGGSTRAVPPSLPPTAGASER
jgi:hypothetical protein